MTNFRLYTDLSWEDFENLFPRHAQAVREQSPEAVGKPISVKLEYDKNAWRRFTILGIPESRDGFPVLILGEGRLGGDKDEARASA